MVSIVSMALLSGCAVEPYVPPSADERLSSASFAIYENIRLQAVVNECKIFGGDTEQLATVSQESWWERNWPYIYAADREFALDTVNRQQEYGQDAGLLFGLKFVMDSEAMAASEAAQVSRAVPNEKKMCQRILHKFRDGDKDFVGSTKHFATLQYLKEKYGVGAAVPYKVPVLDTEFRARSKVGKSYYKAEKLASDNWCHHVSMLNLKDQWPKEIYGAYCDNGSMYLITCHWGNCKSGAQ